MFITLYSGVLLICNVFVYYSWLLSLLLRFHDYKSYPQIITVIIAFQKLPLTESVGHNFVHRWITRGNLSYARFTLADPTSRFASDVVGGKSGRTFQRCVGTPFTLAEWRTMRTFASVGTVSVRWRSLIYYNSLRKTVALYTFGSPRWSPDEAPTADSGSGTHSHWPSRHHRGKIGYLAMWSGHYKKERKLSTVHLQPDLRGYSIKRRTKHGWY